MKKIAFTSIFIIFFLITFMYKDNNFSNFTFPSKTKYITSNYGFRDIFGSISFHDGTDFGAPYISEVYAAANGVISYCGFLNGYGNTISITHENGYITSYSHLASDFKVKLGEYVLAGDTIGYVGPKYLENGILNGLTTGPHLHFRIFKDGKTIDPMSVLK